MKYNSSPISNPGGSLAMTPQRKEILDFIMFEDSTSTIWPWAVPADAVIRDEEKLKAVEDMLDYDPQHGCDTDQLYHALDQIFGVNPSLTEEQKPSGGMLGISM